MGKRTDLDDADDLLADIGVIEESAIAEAHGFHVATGEKIAHAFPRLAVLTLGLLLLPGEAVGFGLEQPVSRCHARRRYRVRARRWRLTFAGHVRAPKPRTRRRAGLLWWPSHRRLARILAAVAVPGRARKILGGAPRAPRFFAFALGEPSSRASAQRAVLAAAVMAPLCFVAPIQGSRPGARHRTAERRSFSVSCARRIGRQSVQWQIRSRPSRPFRTSASLCAFGPASGPRGAPSASGASRRASARPSGRA